MNQIGSLILKCSWQQVEVQGPLLGTADVPLSKAQNPLTANSLQLSMRHL